jgi:hypothetical protein
MPITVQVACVVLTILWPFSFSTIVRLWRGDLGAQRRLRMRIPGSQDRVARKIRALPSSVLALTPALAILPTYYVIGGGTAIDIACVAFGVWVAVAMLIASSVYHLGKPRWAIPPHLRPPNSSLIGISNERDDRRS